MVATTIIEINQTQFITNLLSIKEILKYNALDSNIKLCLPVKSNAYGHGLPEMAKLAEPIVDYLAVARTEEGLTLRRHGLTKPILVFGTFRSEQITDLVINQLEVTIPSIIRAKQIIDVCRQLKKTCNVHIKIDTGMNRIGVRTENAWDLINLVLNSPELQLVGVYSHLASSDLINDPYTHKQINSFKVIVDKVKQIDNGIICHIANSGGLCHYPEAYFDMVRPGILSYGYFPNDSYASTLKIQTPVLNDIKPCFSLKSQVAYFKVVAPLSAISYNQKYITSTQTRIVTLPIGYGDGYRRGLSNTGDALINGKRYKIAGTICMDMTMVDIGPHGTAHVGDEVVLIGKQGDHAITLESVAQKCQTITYEILCDFNDRIPRVYQ